MNYHDIEISDDVISAIDVGHKIEAIKILRERTGLGLADAKHLIDRLARQRQGQPDVALAITEEGGAGGMIRMVVVIGVVLGVYFFFFAG